MCAHSMQKQDSYAQQGHLLTNIFRSNSKMTPTLYNYNTEYTTKWKHSAKWYDVHVAASYK